MKYAVEYITANSSEDLAVEMNNFYAMEVNKDISFRDVIFIPEMRSSQLSPTQPQVIFVAIITYKRGVA